MKTTDRHGLLVDLVKLVAQAKVTVESGEFHAEVTTVQPKYAILFLWLKCLYHLKIFVAESRGSWLRQNFISATAVKQSPKLPRG